MILDNKKEFLNEKLREFIIKNNTEEHLTKYKCKVCNGTGLKNIKKLQIDGGFCWDGEYCDFCEGIGYLNPKKIIEKNGENLYCYQCNGTGVDYNGHCKVCGGTGILNWLKHILG